ncbi:MAG: hypothetical protein IT385_14735 [Deltaproteobacteria bacterium]|nr:hypothetical protein [Deltaproteobacteria bacterium]
MSLTSRLRIASLIAVATTVPAIAHAEPTPPSRTLDLVVAAGDTPVRLSLAIADGTCSQAASGRADDRLRVKVCHLGGDADASTYAFEVERDLGRRGLQRFEVRARVTADAPVVLGRIDHGKTALAITAALTR